MMYESNRTTVQTLFNKVWDHFIVNKSGPGTILEPDGTRRCMYQGPCAVGILFCEADRAELDKDVVLSSQQAKARQGISTLSEEGAALLRDDDLVCFMLRLRADHDLCTINHLRFHERFERELRALAEGWHLTVPEAA